MLYLFIKRWASERGKEKERREKKRKEKQVTTANHMMSGGSVLLLIFLGWSGCGGASTAGCGAGSACDGSFQLGQELLPGGECPVPHTVP